MNISWSAPDPYNATIIDDASDEAIFTLNSPFSLTKKVITLSDARSGQVIAEYESHIGHRDRVTYRGQTHKLSDWLTKKHWFST